MLLEQWKYYDTIMIGYICPNPQNIHQQEWTLTKLLTLGDNDVGSSAVLNEDADNGGGYACMRAGVYGKSSIFYPPFNFVANLKLLKKLSLKSF